MLQFYLLIHSDFHKYRISCGSIHMNKIGAISNIFMKFLYRLLSATSFRFILETF